MNKQLALLIQLSDLDTQLSELKIEKIANQEESLGFRVDIKTKEIESLRENIRKKIDIAILNDYDKILNRYKFRAVSQVVDGVCYGCFVKLPTEFLGKANKNNEIIHCPNCRRILFWIE